MDNSIQKLDKQRMALATGLVCAFCAALIFLLLKEVPKENKDLATYMLGQLSGMATMALTYYFINKAGADQADQAKTENTGKLADAFKAAAISQTADTASKAAQVTADAAQEKADELSIDQFRARYETPRTDK